MTCWCVRSLSNTQRATMSHMHIIRRFLRRDLPRADERAHLWQGAARRGRARRGNARAPKRQWHGRRRRGRDAAAEAGRHVRFVRRSSIRFRSSGQCTGVCANAAHGGRAVNTRGDRESVG